MPTEYLVDNDSSDSTQQSIQKHVFKSSQRACDDKSRVFTASIEMTALIQKQRKNEQHVPGCQLLELVRKGSGLYCKVLAHTSREWDLDTMKCKESETKLEDVI